MTIQTNTPAPSHTAPSHTIPALPGGLNRNLAAPIIPGTLGVHLAPLSQLIHSPCNVRTTHGSEAVENMAAALLASGQLHNLTARWQGETLEVLAGETRRLALQLLADRAEIGADTSVHVHIVQADDDQARALSAAENVARSAMTPMQECRAMADLQRSGSSLQDIASVMGLRRPGEVQGRVLVAESLCDEGQAALEAGTLSLAKAFVIARAGGEALQRTLISRSTYSTADDLKRVLTHGQFLVSVAQFDASTLPVTEDLFGEVPAYFSDKAQALNAQLGEAQRQADTERAAATWAFVDVVSSDHFSTYNAPYNGTLPEGQGGGLVLAINTHSGELRRYERVRRTETATPASGKAPRGIAARGHVLAHDLKAQALSESLLGQTTLTLALSVHSLIMGTEAQTGTVGVRGETPGSPLTETVQGRLAELQSRLGETLSGDPAKGPKLAGLTPGGHPDSGALFAWLAAQTQEVLLDLLNVLIAARSYAYPVADPRVPSAPAFAHAAEHCGAERHLASGFILNAAFLAAYPKGELQALAAEAGIDLSAFPPDVTATALRGHLLGHAAALHARNFLPSLLKFAPGQVQ